jgi:7-cyano-7-deazaguanine synthase
MTVEQDNGPAPGRKAVVLLSGGLDSMVTAALALEQGFELQALTIDYGQRHACELAAADRIARHLAIGRHVRMRLDLGAFGGSALTGDLAVPKGGVTGEIPVTYVPARNLVFLALTTAFAESGGASHLFIGVNALDYSGYPDCRPEFIRSFGETARLGTKAGIEGTPFEIHAPLQQMGKAEIASECARLGLPPGMSWSCYDPQGGGRACGLCDSCRLRRKGFEEAGVQDTTPYAA